MGPTRPSNFRERDMDQPISYTRYLLFFFGLSVTAAMLQNAVGTNHLQLGAAMIIPLMASMDTGAMYVERYKIVPSPQTIKRITCKITIVEMLIVLPMFVWITPAFKNLTSIHGAMSTLALFALVILSYGAYSWNVKRHGFLIGAKAAYKKATVDVRVTATSLLARTRA
jgi:hypothetical protein